MEVLKMTERQLFTAMQAKGIIRWDSSDVIRLHFQKKRLYIELLAKPTLNKINRHKDRLSALQFRGFARISDNWNKKTCDSAPKKSKSHPNRSKPKSNNWSQSGTPIKDV